MQILMFFPGPLLFSEVVAFEALLVCALYMCLCVYGLTGQISISAVMLLAIGIALLVARKWIQRRARSWLTKDMKAYESVFIKGKDQIVAYLDSLSESISTLNLCRNECNLPRQLPGVVDDFVYGMGSKSFSQYLTVQIADNKVKSLDQLFMQAIVLHDMFRSKVEGICSALCGVSVQPPPDGIFLTDFERCLEKAVVTCEGEASRLVDVLRARLVCRDWGCVRSCIQRIAEDSELQVIRVKNRFDRSYDPRQTGGYRDVCLNVCLVTDETWTLGVSGHVCELQLVLKSFLRSFREEQQELSLLYRHIADQEGGQERPVHQRVFSLVDTMSVNPWPSGQEEQNARKSSCCLTGESHRDRDHFAALMRQKCCFPGDLLNEYLAQVCHGVERADISSIMFSTAPIRLGSQKLTLQLFLLFHVSILIWRMLNPYGLVHQAQAEKSFRSYHLRFTTLRDREGKTPMEPGIASLGLLHNGYMLNCSKTKLQTRSNSLYASFEDPVVANGWFFRTQSQGGTEQSDAVLFLLQYSSVPSEAPWSLPSSAWELYGGPECHWKMYSARCHPVARKEYNTSRTRNYTHMFDHRSPWFHTLHGPVTFAISSHFTLTALMGWMKKPVAAKFFWVSGYLVLGGIILFKALMHSCFTSLASSFYWWVSGSSIIGIAVTSWFKERYVMHFLVFHACLTSFAINLYSWLYLGLGLKIPDTAPFLIFSVLVWVVYNKIILYRAWQEIAEDWKHYDALTTRLMNDPDDSQSIESISELSKSLGAGRLLSQYQAISRYRRGSRFSFKSAGFVVRYPGILGALGNMMISMKFPFGSEKRVRPRQIKCFDQLYMQAYLLEPLFLDKIKRLAEQAEGFFLVVDETSETGHSMMRWSECKIDEASQDKVRFAKLKSIDRCVEKISRAYAGDVSRLFDIVRQSIVFENLSSLQRCLEMIAEDSELQVIRVKNRFDRSYDPRQTGGYRDVCLNVCLVTDETWTLGVSGH
eukprot:768720-Hanusia_phi.AAC.1